MGFIQKPRFSSLLLHNQSLERKNCLFVCKSRYKKISSEYLYFSRKSLASSPAPEIYDCSFYGQHHFLYDYIAQHVCGATGTADLDTGIEDDETDLTIRESAQSLLCGFARADCTVEVTRKDSIASLCKTCAMIETSIEHIRTMKLLTSHF